MSRSVNEWTKLLSAPLTDLRREIWQALNDVKESRNGNESLTWEKLIRGWRDTPEWRTVEARWRNGLNTNDSKIDLKDLAEALDALFALRERLLPGETPRVRRLLYGETEPAERLFAVLSPDPDSDQDVGGLIGNWRLVHQQSNGKGYVSWRLTIKHAIEPTGRPQAWFELSTSMGVAAQKNSESQKKITHQVNGAVYAINAMFYLIGTERDGQLVMTSFEVPRGQSTGQAFHRANGLIQRIGSHGLYAARAVITRGVEAVPDGEIGIFSADDAQKPHLDGLSEDIGEIAKTTAIHRNDLDGIPACLLSMPLSDG